MIAIHAPLHWSTARSWWVYLFWKFNSRDWLRGRKTCSVLCLCRTTVERFLRDKAFPFVSIVSVIKTNKPINFSLLWISSEAKGVSRCDGASRRHEESRRRRHVLPSSFGRQHSSPFRPPLSPSVIHKNARDRLWLLELMRSHNTSIGIGRGWFGLVRF